MASAVIKRLVRRALGERRVRSLRTLIGDSSIFTQQAAEYEPGDGNVVVLSPHMDDETLGCGGTIARHAEAGAHVTVIFLTDGRHGGPPRAGMTGSERDAKQREIIEIRKEEAQCAGRILGVRSIVFLDAEDTRLRLDTRAPKLLRDVLIRERPDCVYLPSFLENHIDHRAAGSVLSAAAAGTGLQFECRSYEVWTPLFPNRVVNIDATMELKKRAIACYRSQLAQMDYLHAAIGLNAHRSLALGGMAGQFAEAFHALPLVEYLRLYRAVAPSMLK